MRRGRENEREKRCKGGVTSVSAVYIAKEAMMIEGTTSIHAPKLPNGTFHGLHNHKNREKEGDKKEEK